MKKIKIYLSGAITGRENYKQEFYEAKEKLIKFQEDNNKRKRAPEGIQATQLPVDNVDWEKLAEK